MTRRFVVIHPCADHRIATYCKRVNRICRSGVRVLQWNIIWVLEDRNGGTNDKDRYHKFLDIDPLYRWKPNAWKQRDTYHRYARTRGVDNYHNIGSSEYPP